MNEISTETVLTREIDTGWIEGWHEIGDGGSKI